MLSEKSLRLIIIPIIVLFVLYFARKRANIPKLDNREGILMEMKVAKYLFLLALPFVFIVIYAFDSFDNLIHYFGAFVFLSSSIILYYYGWEQKIFYKGSEITKIGLLTQTFTKKLDDISVIYPTKLLYDITIKFKDGRKMGMSDLQTGYGAVLFDLLKKVPRRKWKGTFKLIYSQ